MNDEHLREVADHVLTCHHCGSTEFTRRTAQLNTPFLTFLNLDWLNASADIFVCEGCGYLHWFLHPGVITEQDKLDCMACGALIPNDQSECPVCGWTWRTEEAMKEGDE